MSKQKLPSNWIVLNSKTHPDRVYYFNVKTNQSSWEEPKPESCEEGKTKTKESARKLQRFDEDCSFVQYQPTTPEHDAIQSTKSKRKKLVAKRTLEKSEEKKKEVKDTPQMQDLREKILKRKQQNASKTAKNIVQLPSTPKSIEKNKPLTSTPQNSVNTKTQTFTPQMLAIYEKMQKKSVKATPTKEQKNNNEQTSAKKGGTAKLRRPKTRSINNHNCTVTSLSDISIDYRDNNTFTEDISCKKDERKTQLSISSPKATLRAKSLDNTSIITASSKKSRKSRKKNLGKERMEKLRRSLNAQITSCESDDGTNSSKSTITTSNISTSNEHCLSPIIYKNAEVRLVRLKQRLLNNNTSVNKKVVSDKSQTQENSCSTSVTTLDDLVKQCYDSSCCEEMDWEPMEDEKITFEIQSVRTQLSTEKNTSSAINIPNTLKRPSSLEQQEKRELYIVIDTNVFLSNIEAVDTAKDTVFKTYDKPIIVVPWTVIRELDYIKDKKSQTKSAALCAKARKAINYLNLQFSSKNPNVIGQTPEDVKKNKERFAIDCPDDEILQTCLQIRDLRKSVVLMSYDVNLCNKAMIYDITTIGRNDPLEKIDYLNVSHKATNLFLANEENTNGQDLESTFILHQEMHMSNEIYEDLKNVIRDFLTVIVSKEMHELYGESWDKHVIIKPPWTVVTVLQCAVKHWIAAISEAFLRKAEPIFKYLLNIFENLSEGSKTLKEVSCILEKSGDLIQMINIDRYPDLMLRASRKIDELKYKCREYEVQINEKKLKEAIGTADDVAEQQLRAHKAFQYFEAVYVYARDMCGLAADMAGIPCSFHYVIPNPQPSQDDMKRIQTELAANVNRLLQTLNAAIEKTENSGIDCRTLISLYQILVTFLPESVLASANVCNNLVPLDVYCCMKLKNETLKTGLRQLQELSTHLWRLVNCRST